MSFFLILFFFVVLNNHKINDKYWPIFNGWSNNLMDFLFKKYFTE